MNDTTYYTKVALQAAAVVVYTMISLRLLRSLVWDVKMRSLKLQADLKLREHMQRSNQPTEQTHD